jgi:hypothetical protein
VRGHTYNGLQGQGVSDERRCDEHAQGMLGRSGHFLEPSSCCRFLLHASAVPTRQQRLATQALSAQAINYRCEAEWTGMRAQDVEREQVEQLSQRAGIIEIIIIDLRWGPEMCAKREA